LRPKIADQAQQLVLPGDLRTQLLAALCRAPDQAWDTILGTIAAQLVL
jgi:hypothetical protein